MKKQNTVIKVNINNILSQVPAQLVYSDILLPYIKDYKDELIDILQNEKLIAAAEKITMNFRRLPSAAEFIKKLRAYLDDDFCSKLLQLHICISILKKDRIDKHKLRYISDLFNWY